MVKQNCDNFQYIRVIDSSSSGDMITPGMEGNIWYETDTDKLSTFIGDYYWRKLEGAGEKQWSDVCSSSDGTKLAACVYGGYIYTSDDSGATWTEQTGSGSRNWVGCVCSLDGIKIIAIVESGYIYTSDDSGATWTERTGAGSRNWRYLSSSSNCDYIYAVPTVGNVYLSTDFGATWGTISEVGSHYWGGSFVSNDNQYIIFCEDTGKLHIGTNFGSNWEQNTNLVPYITSGVYSLVASQDIKYIYTITYDKTIVVSGDYGENFSISTVLSMESPFGLDTSPTGNFSIVVTNFGNVYTSNTYGTTWNKKTINSLSASFNNVSISYFSNYAIISSSPNLFSSDLNYIKNLKIG